MAFDKHIFVGGDEKSTRRSFLSGVVGTGLVATSGGTVVSPVPPPYPYAAGDLGGYVPGSQQSFSLRNGTILDGDGSKRAGGVRVEAGKIVEIGELKSGDDLGGAILFPGFFDGGTPVGLWEVDLEATTHDESESSDAMVPAASVLDAYNALSVVIPVARRQGVLGALCTPIGGLVSGQAAWMRFAGDRTSEATMVGSAGLMVNLGRGGTGGLPNQPKSRMGVMMKLREVLDAHKLPDDPHAGCTEAEKSAKKCESNLCKKGKASKGEKPPEFTRAQKVWHQVRRRELKLILAANRADDILSGIALAKEYDLDVALMGIAEGHLVAKDIAEAGIPAIVGPITIQPSGWDSFHAKYENAAILHAAGVPLILRAGTPHNLRELPTETGVAVAHGLPYEAAIAASCGYNAAKVWKQLPIGSIRVGASATFVVANGDPIQPRTRMSRAWIAGREVSLRSRQIDLFERFRSLW